jgi:hypothetical protein
MLLNCGHDLCKGCLNYQFKKDKKVICDVCNADCKYDIFLTYIF